MASNSASWIEASAGCAALRAEVAALRQVVEAQTAPDYALTLGAIVKALEGGGTWLEAIEASPPLRATPASVAQEVRPEAGRWAESQVAQAQAARVGKAEGARFGLREREPVISHNKKSSLQKINYQRNAAAAFSDSLRVFCR